MGVNRGYFCSRTGKAVQSVASVREVAIPVRLLSGTKRCAVYCHIVVRHGECFARARRVHRREFGFAPMGKVATGTCLVTSTRDVIRPTIRTTGEFRRGRNRVSFLVVTNSIPGSDTGARCFSIVCRVTSRVARNAGPVMCTGKGRSLENVYTSGVSRCSPVMGKGSCFSFEVNSV